MTGTNCVGVISALPGDGRNDPAPVVWPQGWSARWENGKATLYDTDGHLYAREGDKVSLPGINGDDGYSDQLCADGHAPFKVNNNYTSPTEA
ncbi:MULTISPECIES: hypothetical protein [unclassified Streptomyces]|uniref:hypothetical protein n=1 Tax=unclassified Streptomyces TaxID=2593676 RepID=UPI0036C879F1